MKSLPTARAERPLSDQLADPCRSAIAGRDAPEAAVQDDLMPAVGEAVFAPAPFRTRSRLDGCSELPKMRHDLFGEQFHVVDLPVEIAGFGAEPEP